jgi:2-iminobutanoate/2-iminopropanoate deaminase
MPRTASANPDGPPPAGPYSPCVRSGPMVFVSGQSGRTPDGHLADDIVAQAEECLANVLATLASGGATEEDVVKVGVYLTHVEHFAAMNEVYARTFSTPPPARTTVYVGLPPGMLIEVDAMAVLSAQSSESTG